MFLATESLSVNFFTNIATSFVQTIIAALTKLGTATVDFLPNFAAALIIVAIGWLIGMALKTLIELVLKTINLDQMIEEQNLSSALGGKNISSLIGSFVKWYIIAVFLAQATKTFQLEILGDFLNRLALFIPVVLVALVIIAIGLLIARYVRNALEVTTHSHRKTIALVVEIAIVYLSVVVGLGSVGIDVSILEDVFRIAFTAFALTIAIIAGISFGFAFKDDAKKLLKEFQK